MTEPLETARLVLEPLRVEHAALCFLPLCDATLYPYVPQDPPTSVEELEVRFQKLELGAPPSLEEVWLNWFVRLRSSADYVGFVQATVRLPERHALLAYQTFLPFRRRGYAAEACRRVVDYLSATFSLEAILAEIDTRNQPSRKLVESLGFIAGPVRENADFFKGQSSDEITYRLELMPRS